MRRAPSIEGRRSLSSHSLRGSASTVLRVPASSRGPSCLASAFVMDCYGMVKVTPFPVGTAEQELRKRCSWVAAHAEGAHLDRAVEVLVRPLELDPGFFARTAFS